MFIAALFTIAKVWKQPMCPSTDEWIKKMWCICTMEYYSAIKKNEILPFATTWMDLTGIMLSEISQREKDKYCMTEVPNLFGTRDWFHGRQFFPLTGEGGDGSGGNASDGEWQMKFRSLVRHLPPAVWPGS